MSERRTSLVGGLLVAVGPVSMALYTPAMPALVEAFGTSQSVIKLTLSLYFLGFAVTQLLCGPLSDAYGRRRVTVIFMGLYLVGSVAAVLTPSIEGLLAARLLQGIGASVGVSTARAIVRDQFVGERSARIMNTIGIILAIGPALSPTIGGLTLELAGWHAIFIVMVLFGLGVIGVTLGVMRETVVADPSLIRPHALLGSYRRILSDKRFLCCSLVLGGSVGALYTLATVLPFVLIDRAGLTPTAYGIGMLGQSGMFLAGSLALRVLMRRRTAAKLVAPGLCFIGVGSAALAASIAFLPLSYASVMAPVGLYAFGIAFVLPAMSTASLAGFSQIAGAASAALGFVQMGLGLAGGLLCAAIGDPVLATQIVIPALGTVAILAYAAYRRLPPLPDADGPQQGDAPPAAPERIAPTQT